MADYYYSSDAEQQQQLAMIDNDGALQNVYGDATSTWSFGNSTAEADESSENFESVVRIVVPILFSFIAVLGLVGNLSVIIVVVSNLQMRSTTNTLIISLAIADLMFIVICVPFTAVAYGRTVWPFGTIFCQVRPHGTQ